MCSSFALNHHIQLAVKIEIRIPLIQNTSFMSIYIINCMKLNRTFAVQLMTVKVNHFNTCLALHTSVNRHIDNDW